MSGWCAPAGLQYLDFQYPNFLLRGTVLVVLQYLTLVLLVLQNDWYRRLVAVAGALALFIPNDVVQMANVHAMQSRRNSRVGSMGARSSTLL